MIVNIYIRTAIPVYEATKSHTLTIDPMSSHSDVFLFGAEQETTMAFHNPTLSHGQSYDPCMQDDTYCQLSQLAINPMQDFMGEAQMDSAAWGWWHPRFLRQGF
jgi:hypothetical protein